MPVSDHASIAAAQTAGYRVVQSDRGAGKSPRYVTRVEKPVTGGTDSGSLLAAEGTSDVSQAAADSSALAALNAQRQHRYGGAPGRASGSANSPDARGASLTADQH